MGLLGKLSSKYTSKNGIPPSASKYVSNKFVERCLQILNNKYVLNGIKGIKTIQKRE